MNRDYMANMLFNINDVVETIQTHINELHDYFSQELKE